VLFWLGGGRYAVEARLGAGAGGEVFAGRDTLLERPVAIKRLPPDAEAITPGGLPEDATQGQARPGPPRTTGAEERAARLLAEARAIARLSHPNIVAVHDVVHEQGRIHLVLERVPGPALRQWLEERGPLALDELAHLARQLAAALEHAHQHGVVHRDLKPENVLLAPGGLAKLVDFGIARMAGADRLTNPGEAVGTPVYVAPEQATGAAVDGRADLYALGCVLYEAATGRPPFEAETPLLVISQHLYATPIPPSARRPELPPAWDAAILRLLAKRPEERFASAAALAQELDRLDAPPVASAASAASAPSTPEHPAPAARQRILAADDERDLAEVLEFVLQRAGYETMIAHDGALAWERVLAERPDLVVLDINMPGLDGCDVLKRIRSLPGAQAATPVIMLTARNDEPSIVAALDAGADDYIAKPFSPRQLLARIRAALRHAGR
jgi:serine/threonine-protein kinase